MRRIEELEERLRFLETKDSYEKMSYSYRPMLSSKKQQKLIDQLYQFAIDTMEKRDPQSVATLPSILKYLLEGEPNL